MDTVAVIVISALVNLLVTGLVGGIIIYRFQKEMDATYTKQMEEFKSSLQNISFEQQVKFEKLYPKRVGTLEVLCKKYDIFSDALTGLIMLKGTMSAKEQGEIQDKLNDFWKDYENNRLFLPLEMLNEITPIYFDSLNLINAIFLLSNRNYIFHNLAYIVQLTQQSNFLQDWFDNENIQKSMLHFVPVLINHSKALEKLYRITAEAKQ